MYADDVKMYREVRSGADGDLLHADLHRLVNWSSVWKLKLNVSKCKVFTITLKRSPVINSYVIGNEMLERVSMMRDLGVVLDQKLTFQSHIDCIVNKGNRALGILIRSLQAGRGRRRYETGAMVAAYHANVRSVLENCSVIWGGAAVTHLDRIEHVQHKFLIWLTVHSGIRSKSLSYSSLLSAHSFNSLSSRRLQHDLVFLARLFNHQIDSTFLRSGFGLAVPVRSVRHRDLLAVPYARVDTVKNGLFCRLPRGINQFLHENNQVDLFSDSLFTFRIKCKEYASRMTTRAHPPNV